MPCKVDVPAITDSDRERAGAVYSNWETAANEITHAMDVLREKILAGDDLDAVHLTGMKSLLDVEQNAYTEMKRREDHDYQMFYARTIDVHVTKEMDRAHAKIVREASEITKMDTDSIRAAQIQHRTEELRRVISVLNARGDFDGVRRAASVDVNKPLIPQLGVDPDEV